MEIKKEIRGGQMIPKHYGLAYLEMDRLIGVCYPIPLNIFIGYLRKFYHWLRMGKSYYESGYDKGYQEGQEKGREYAFEQYKTQALQGEIKNIIVNFIDQEDFAMKLPRSDPEKMQGWIWEFIDKESKRITNPTKGEEQR